MVTPETLNALEVVKLILFLQSLTPPLSDLSFSLFLSCDRHICVMFLQADADLSLTQPPDHSIPIISTIHSICLYSFWRNSSVFLYCHVSDGNKTDIGSLLVVYSFRLYLFSFFLQLFSSVCHLKQYFPAFLNLFIPGVPLVRSMHGLQSWNILL